MVIDKVLFLIRQSPNLASTLIITPTMTYDGRRVEWPEKQAEVYICSTNHLSTGRKPDTYYLMGASCMTILPQGAAPLFVSSRGRLPLIIR